MEILCLGLSHHTAPVELRERLTYPPAALKAALARLGCGRETRPASLSELIILSTCNRLELYACTSMENASEAGDDPSAALLDLVVETRGLPAPEFAHHLYRHTGRTAVEHLCRVAAGLDSMILGEPQILGQVAQAYEMALGLGAAGVVLGALFRAAIRAGKRARTETAISRNPASAGSVAVTLAESVVGDLSAARVLVVGAGEMAELALEALRKRGVLEIAVANRTHDRAARLASRWGARALTFERLGEALAEADIVIASTGAPHTLITTDLTAEAISRRLGRPLVFIDIAVPRDVDPDVRRLPGVHYYDIDDLQSRLADSLAVRGHEVPRVEAIAAEETTRFMTWLTGLEIAPLIAHMRARADAIRRAEVEKTLRRLPHLPDADRRRVEALSESLVNKLLHEPTLRLRAEAGNGRVAHYAAAARYLFALED